jgi:hypothetical protein
MGGSPIQLLGLWPTLVDKTVVDAGVRIDFQEV